MRRLVKQQWNARRFSTLACALGAMALGNLSGCIEPDSGPTVESVTISPDTLKESQAGMGDEYFTVTIVTSGFESPITKATAINQELADDDTRAVAKGETTIDGDTVTISQIRTSWFGGLEPDTYNIKVSVESDLTEIERASAATVTILPN